MNDTAFKIADKSGLPSGGAKAIARRIRSAIRRAVQAERTRIIGIVEDEFAGQRKYAAIRIVSKINQAKRPSRKRK